MLELGSTLEILPSWFPALVYIESRVAATPGELGVALTEYLLP